MASASMSSGSTSVQFMTPQLTARAAVMGAGSTAVQYMSPADVPIDPVNPDTGPLTTELTRLTSTTLLTRG